MIDRKALAGCLSRPVLHRSLMVALVVGTALNAINQGDALLAGHAPVWWKLALTYVVPLLVASYGAYSALAGTRAAEDPPTG